MNGRYLTVQPTLVRAILVGLLALTCASAARAQSGIYVSGNAFADVQRGSGETCPILERQEATVAGGGARVGGFLSTRWSLELGVDTGAAAEPIVEELPAAAEAPGYEVLSGPRGVADDLTKLHHVSPTIEKKLNDLGIFHYWQIAGLGPEAAHKIGEEVGLPGRVEGWIAQSKELTAE